MSWEVELWVKRQKTGNPVLKAVLLSIGNWIDPQNNWQVVSIRRLADETEVSERTVQRHINTLIELGFLEREERQRPGGGSGWNAYRMRGYAPVRVSNVEPERPALPAGDDAKRGNNLTPPGCQSVTGGGDKAVTPILKKDNLPLSPNGDAPQGAAAGVSPRADRGTRLPDDWAPPPIADLPPAARTVAIGWPRGAYQMVAEQFRSHWHARSDRGCRKKDWGKAWQEWVLKAPRDVASWQRSGVVFGEVSPDAPPAKPWVAPTVAAKSREDERSAALHAAVKGKAGADVHQQWIEPCALIFDAPGLRVITAGDHIRVRVERFAQGLKSAARVIDEAIQWVTFEVERAGQREG